MKCPFCALEHKPLLETPLALAIFDIHPASRGHMLVLPRRHVADWFDTTIEERRDIWLIADSARALLLRDFKPDGFTLGINVGEAAGQTVFHAHLHIIPRYRGDVPNPRGGVRAVIPWKQHD